MSIFIGLILVIFILIFVIFPMGALLHGLKRKFVADVEMRIGPQQVGANGLFQPIADGLTQLAALSNQFKGSLSTQIALICDISIMIASLLTLPFGKHQVFFESDLAMLIPIGILYFRQVVLGIAEVFGTNVDNRIEGFRRFSFACVAILPALVVILSMGYAMGTYRWEQIFEFQKSLPFQYGVFFAPPFGIVQFSVLYLAGLILLGTRPFDSPVSFSRWSQMPKFLTGATVEFFYLFYWALFNVLLFFGGADFEALTLTEVLVVSGKTFLLISATIILGYGIPKPRSEHALMFTWRVLFPLAWVGGIGVGLYSMGGN